MSIPDIKTMTLREKIAQLLIVRQSDLIMDSSTAYSKFRDPSEAKELCEKYQFGGIWLHGSLEINHFNKLYTDNINYDCKELLDWYANIRENVKIPMIAANDAWGVGTCRDLSTYPKGLAVGASSNEDAAFELGRAIGMEMSCCGTDWIWSPIADKHDRRASVIVRQYSNYTDDIIRCATGYMKGLQSVNVAATLKHFPGADPSETRDSHIVTTGIKMSKEDWWKDQGRIFQSVIDAGVDSVMVGAKAFPAMDSTKVRGRYISAGLSYKMVTELLKEKMGFEGVVITDDVNMGGFTSFYNGGRLYAEFIKAGNDMLLGVGVDAVDLLEEEVKKGTVSVERIDDAVSRVLKLKEKLGLFDKGYRKPEWSVADAVNYTTNMSKKLATTSATLVRDREGVLPFDKNKIKKVTIICHTHLDSIMDDLKVMKKEFEDHGAKVTLRRKLEDYEDAKRVADSSDLIVYAGYLGFHAPKGAPSFYGDEFWAFQRALIYGVEKSVGVSLGYPHIHYDYLDDANVFVNIYSPAPEMQKAFVKGLYGEIEFVGKSPVNLDE